MRTTLYQLGTTLAKEVRVIVRDKEALLILFVMPVVFVLIMSLALRDAFSERAGIRFSLLIVDQEKGQVGKSLIKAFEDSDHFQVTAYLKGDKNLPEVPQIEEDLRTGQYKFALIIPNNATQQARRRARAQLELAGRGVSGPASVDIRLLSDPALRRDHRDMVTLSLNRALQAVESGLLLEQFAALSQQQNPAGAKREPPKSLDLFKEIGAEQLGAENSKHRVPTSVQQNAPAWTLLAMFFLVIPLSVTLIKERQQGSLLRLQTLPIPGWVILAGKTLPYFLINQLQVVVILLVSVYLLPQLGGDALALGDSPVGIVLVSVCASLAAIGYGMLVAVFARTPEQATTFGATSVLILAALGGVLVPSLVMPPFLQQLAVVSPLSWGLEGFLDIFVRAATWQDILPECAQLLAFAGICWAVTLARFYRRLRPN